MAFFLGYSKTKPGFPSGAIGLWHMDQYVTSPSTLVPNAITGTAVSTNLFKAPRRAFNNTTLWSGLGTTIVDSAATAPDSSNDASTVVAAGAWLVATTLTSNFPAGTYTFGINAKRNTGADQVFKFDGAGGGLSATKTATSVWQRFSYTFTLAVPTSAAGLRLISDNFGGGTGVNIQICDFGLFAGSSDPGPETFVGHLYLGVGTSGLPTPSTGLLDFSNGSAGVIQFPSSTAFTSGAVTACAAIKKVTNGVGSSLLGFLSDFKNNNLGYSNFSAKVYPDNLAVFHNYGTNSLQAGYLGGGSSLWEPFNQGWHMMSMRYDGTKLQLWLDDIPIFSQPFVIGTISACDFFVGLVAGQGNLHQISEIALWNRTLSISEMRQVKSAMATRMAISGIAFSDARVLCVEGDSISTADGGLGLATAYPVRYNSAPPSPLLLGNNFSISGSLISGLVTRAPTVDAVLPATLEGRKLILSVFDGHNDIAADTSPTGVSTWLTSYASYLDARRAAGWIVVVCTILPSTAASFNGTPRNSANTEIRLWTTNGSTVPGKHADYVCDFAADPTIGVDAAAANATYYSDGTHPTNAGHIIMQTIYAAVINAI